MLFAELLVCRLTAPRAVRARGVEGALRRMAARRPWGRRTDPARVAAVLGVVQPRARVLMRRRTCLEESVALAAVLARRGSQPDLVLGCRRYADGAWGAHAWVEVGPLVFDPVPAGEHMELTRYEASTDWRPRASTG